jgi:hypothetical protein
MSEMPCDEGSAGKQPCIGIFHQLCVAMGYHLQAVIGSKEAQVAGGMIAE